MKRTISSRSSAKPKEDSASELFEAVMAGKISEVKRLVEKGAKVNSQKRDGFTPLMLAAFHGNEKVVEYLIRHGADVNLRNYIGQTALMIAAKSGHNAIIDLLVLARADVRAVDNENRNAIAWAVSYADFPETVSKLAVIGADYDHQDAQGLTPLMRAALLGFDQAVGVLLALGADETVKLKGKTAYDMAVENGHKEVCATIKNIVANRPKGHRL